MRFLSILLISLVASQAFAKEVAGIDFAGLKHPVKPMLWKVEGKGLKQESYLFGTIHLSDQRLTTLHPAAQKAFDQSGALYTELELSMASQMAMVGTFMRKDKISLEQLLGNELYAALEEEIRAVNPALSVKPFAQFKIWALGMMIPGMKDQLSGKQPLDMQLWTRATKAGQKTGALEQVSDQVGKLDQLTIEEQKHMLEVTLKLLKKSRETGVDPFAELVNAYLSGDTEVIEGMLSQDSYLGIKMDPALVEKFYRLLLHERNVGMANTILDVLAGDPGQTSFFAAGAAHYIGEKSVISLLEDAGYKVTRM